MYPEADPYGDKMMVEVSAAGLNLRSTPSVTVAKVGFYKHGDKVEILEIQTVNGTQWGRTKDGWIVMAYVQIIE